MTRYLNVNFWQRLYLHNAARAKRTQRSVNGRDRKNASANKAALVGSVSGYREVK